MMDNCSETSLKLFGEKVRQNGVSEEAQTRRDSRENSELLNPPINLHS